LVRQGTPVPVVLLLPLIGLAFAFVQLRRYYSRASQLSSVAV